MASQTWRIETINEPVAPTEPWVIETKVEHKTFDHDHPLGIEDLRPAGGWLSTAIWMFDKGILVMTGYERLTHENGVQVRQEQIWTRTEIDYDEPVEVMPVTVITTDGAGPGTLMSDDSIRVDTE